MKLPERPASTDPAGIDPTTSKDRTRRTGSTSSGGGVRLKVVLLAITVIAVIIFSVLANRASRTDSDHTVVPPPQVRLLQVEVLDGMGNMKIAQQMTDIIRSLRYDVVEMKKNADGTVDRSVVYDRSGKFEAARSLAEQLGIPPERVFRKPDRNLFLDATVIVGKDYSRLKVFQSFRERSTH